MAGRVADRGEVAIDAVGVTGVEHRHALLVRLESGGSRPLALLAMHELVAASWEGLVCPRLEHLVSKIVAFG